MACDQIVTTTASNRVYYRYIYICIYIYMYVFYIQYNLVYKTCLYRKHIYMYNLVYCKYLK